MHRILPGVGEEDIQTQVAKGWERNLGRGNQCAEV